MQSSNSSKWTGRLWTLESPRKRRAMRWQRAEWNAWSPAFKTKWKLMRCKKDLVMLMSNTHTSWIKSNNYSSNEHKLKLFFFQFIWLKFNQLLIYNTQFTEFHKMVELNGISEFVKYNSLPYESWREWVTLG